jgi:hypothetical protein
LAFGFAALYSVWRAPLYCGEWLAHRARWKWCHLLYAISYMPRRMASSLGARFLARHMPSAVRHMLFAICSRQLELLLNFLLTWLPDTDCHIPLTRHAEIRFGLIEAIFGVFGVRLGNDHAGHSHRVLE